MGCFSVLSFNIKECPTLTALAVWAKCMKNSTLHIISIQAFIPRDPRDLQ